jgi:hypothetical protein
MCNPSTERPAQLNATSTTGETADIPSPPCGPWEEAVSRSRGRLAELRAASPGGRPRLDGLARITSDPIEAVYVASHWICLSEARRVLHWSGPADAQFFTAVRGRLWGAVQAGLLRIRDLTECFSIPPARLGAQEEFNVNRDWLRLDPGRLGCGRDHEAVDFRDANFWILPPRSEKHCACPACTDCDAYLDVIDATLIVRWHMENLVDGGSCDDPSAEWRVARIKELLDMAYVTRGRRARGGPGHARRS